MPRGGGRRDGPGGIHSQALASEARVTPHTTTQAQTLYNPQSFSPLVEVYECAHAGQLVRPCRAAAGRARRLPQRAAQLLHRRRVGLIQHSYTAGGLALQPGRSCRRWAAEKRKGGREASKGPQGDEACRNSVVA